MGKSTVSLKHKQVIVKSATDMTYSMIHIAFLSLEKSAKSGEDG